MPRLNKRAGAPRFFDFLKLAILRDQRSLYAIAQGGDGSVYRSLISRWLRRPPASLALAEELADRLGLELIAVPRGAASRDALDALARHLRLQRKADDAKAPATNSGKA